MSDAIIVLDDQFKVIYPNQAMIDLSGFSKNDLIHTNFHLFDTSKHGDTFKNDVINQVNQYGEWQGETWLKRADKKTIFVWLKLFRVTDIHQQFKLYVASYRNLSHRDDDPNMLQYFAQKDALTSLYNRFYFNSEVTQKLQSKKHLKQYLAFIDMDNFKLINDQFGHMFGDDVLVRFGQILKSIFSGHLIARYGGDEFVVYFNGKTTDNDIKMYQLEFQQQVVTFFKKTIPNVNVTASMGIAVYPEDGTSIQELIDTADKKMYHLKRGKA